VVDAEDAEVDVDAAAGTGAAEAVVVADGDGDTDADDAALSLTTRHLCKSATAAKALSTLSGLPRLR
jgi:hypothetical protein